MIAFVTINRHYSKNLTSMAFVNERSSVVNFANFETSNGARFVVPDCATANIDKMYSVPSSAKTSTAPTSERLE